MSSDATIRAALRRYYANRDAINAAKRAERRKHNKRVNAKAKAYRDRVRDRIRRYSNAYAKKRYASMKLSATALQLACEELAKHACIHGKTKTCIDPNGMISCTECWSCFISQQARRKINELHH